MPHAMPAQNRAAAEAMRGAQAAPYNSGVLLHNWFEDRFAPKAGALADVYPMPPTTYKEEFTTKSAVLRPMLRTGDLGKEILFGQGNNVQDTLPSASFGKYEKKKQEWKEMRDPEHAGRLISTKHAVDSVVAKEAKEIFKQQDFGSRNRVSGFTQSTLTDHTQLSLRQ